RRLRCLPSFPTRRSSDLGIEFALLAFVLLLGRRAGDRGRVQACLSGAQRLQRITDFDLDQLLKLLSLRRNLFPGNQRMAQLALGDRKSTRLNSSHVAISY